MATQLNIRLLLDADDNNIDLIMKDGKIYKTPSTKGGSYGKKNLLNKPALRVLLQHQDLLSSSIKKSKRNE